MSGAPRYSYRINPESNTTAAKVVRLVGRGKRVLELGCAGGHMSEVLRDRECQVVAVEIDPEAARMASRFCEEVVVGDLDQLDLAERLGNRRFDVVVAADVLEHLRDPLSLLRRATEFLSPDGYWVVSVPNVAHGSVRLGLLQGSFAYTDSGLLDRTHLRFFTKQTLDELFGEADLVISHLDRNRVSIEDSEVKAPPSAPGVVDAVLQDPEGLTYQFIVTAYPLPRPAVEGIRRRFERIAEENRSVREELKGYRKSLQTETALRRRIRRLIATKNDLAAKIGLLEKSLSERRELIQRLAASDQEREQATETMQKEMGRLAEVVESLLDSQRQIHFDLRSIDARLRQHVEETRAKIETAPSSQTGPPPVAPRAGDPHLKSGPLELGEYPKLVDRIRDLVHRRLPFKSMILVASKGDDALLRWHGRTAEHFPQTEHGIYAGFHPASSEDAIHQLEGLRAKKKIHYLLFPRTAFWWLTHYEGLRAHLEKHYREFLREPDTCVIYDLSRVEADPQAGEPAIEVAVAESISPMEELVEWLLPSEQPLVVLGAAVEPSFQLGDRPLFWCRAQGGEAETIERIEELRRQGCGFLLVPSELHGWLERRPALNHYLESNHRRLLFRKHVCTIYSLSKEGLEPNVST